MRPVGICLTPRRRKSSFAISRVGHHTGPGFRRQRPRQMSGSRFASAWTVIFEQSSKLYRCELAQTVQASMCRLRFREGVPGLTRGRRTPLPRIQWMGTIERCLPRSVHCEMRARRHPCQSWTQPRSSHRFQFQCIRWLASDCLKTVLRLRRRASRGRCLGTIVLPKR